MPVPNIRPLRSRHSTTPPSCSAGSSASTSLANTHGCPVSTRALALGLSFSERDTPNSLNAQHPTFNTHPPSLKLRRTRHPRTSRSDRHQLFLKFRLSPAPLAA